MCLHIYFQNESLFTFAFNFAQVYAMQLAVLIREYVANLSNIQCMALSFVLVPRRRPAPAARTLLGLLSTAE